MLPNFNAGGWVARKSQIGFWHLASTKVRAKEQNALNGSIYLTKHSY